MAVVLAFLVMYGKLWLKLPEGENILPHIASSFWLGLLVYPLLLGLLVWLPLKRMKEGGPSIKIE